VRASRGLWQHHCTELSCVMREYARKREKKKENERKRERDGEREKEKRRQRQRQIEGTRET